MYICPKCGAQENTKKFLGPFCIDCYIDCHYFKIKIPDNIKVEQCKRCMKIKLRGKWIEFSERKIKEYVENEFKGEFTSAEFFQDEKKAIFTIEKNGAKAEITKRINFGFDPTICPECNKKAGGYFEAIIQLRGNDKRIKKYFRIFEEELEKSETFISKVVESKEGLDIYAGSTTTVLGIIKKLGLEYKVSAKLAGQKQGKRLYRTTFAIRF